MGGAIVALRGSAARCTHPVSSHRSHVHSIRGAAQLVGSQRRRITARRPHLRLQVLPAPVTILRIISQVGLIVLAVNIGRLPGGTLLSVAVATFVLFCLGKPYLEGGLSKQTTWPNGYLDQRD